MAWVVVAILDSVHSQPSLDRMTRRRNSQQTTQQETRSSAIEIIDMDLSRSLEIDFRIAIIKTIPRLEKSVSDNIESLRT